MTPDRIRDAHAMPVRLTLNEDGSTQYVVRWLLEKDFNIRGKITVDGWWTRQVNTPALTFPHQNDKG
jgi:hypothetical protein